MAQIEPTGNAKSASAKAIWKISGTVLALLALSAFVSRAPTTFTGTLPLVSLPLNLNVVYLIVFGPPAAVIVSVVIWYLSRQLKVPVASDIGQLPLAVIFVLITALTAFLSLQYFVVLAPAGHCSDGGGFSLLFNNLDGTTQINHCMSGTEEINKAAPFYMYPQAAESWGMIIWPILTGGLLYRAWTSIGRKTL
ncbi:hypothetical protein [Rhizobium jaguaris]|uniref:Uncharacterized protein n=1 Tax=Rhizobium jaguaris TaxID=1312183 RepID=A0A387FWM6_9HYPH|nr:hypothetical protein [Rhizobium jaguaris]AYG59922.1 hypothetical protein CCGE525_14730 [Rhizobium jaguaris]